MLKKIGKRVPLIIVHDSSDSSDEEHESNSSTSTVPIPVEPTSVLKNGTEDQQWAPGRNSSSSPNLDDLQVNSDCDSEAESFSSDSDSEKEEEYERCGSMETLSSMSTAYHSVTRSTPTSPQPTTPVVTNNLDNQPSVQQLIDINTRQIVEEHCETSPHSPQPAVTTNPPKPVILQVFSDNESMDISSCYSSSGDEMGTTKKKPRWSSSGDDNIKETNQDNSGYFSANLDIISTLKQLGVTNDEDISTISKYCILKFDRLYCNFNPSSASNRGCQNSFAKEEIDKFRTHLTFFHNTESCQIATNNQHESSQPPDTISSDRNYKEVDDNKSVGSLDDELYALGSEASTEEENHVRTPTEDYNPDDDDCTPVISQNQNSKSQHETQNSVSLVNKEITTTSATPIIDASSSEPVKLTHATRRKLKPRVNRVTPKVLRSSTKKATPEQQQQTSTENSTVSKINDQHATTSLTKKTSKQSSTPEAPKASDAKPKQQKSRSNTEEPPSKRPYARDRSENLKQLAEAREIRSQKIMAKRAASVGLTPTEKAASVSTTTPVPTKATSSTSVNASSTQIPSQAFPKANSVQEPAPTVRHFTPVPRSQTQARSPARDVSREVTPGSEVLSVIPVLPKDGTWPFQYGFGFFMKNRYHCNVTRSTGPSGCKATFLNRSVLIQHLNAAHQINERNVMSHREAEDDNHVQNQVIDMIISTGLPSHFVGNKKFVDMLTAIRGIADNSIHLPNLERTRQLIHEEYVMCENRVKELLQAQDHISFSVNVWNSIPNPKDSILIVTAFYIDETWSLKDVIIGFRPLSSPVGSSVETESLIEEDFIEILKQFDVLDKVHTVTCPDIPDSVSVNEHLTNEMIISVPPGSSRRLYTPCLDQIIEIMKECLYNNIEFKFGPLKNIYSAMGKLSHCNRLTSSTVITPLREFSNTYTTVPEILREIPSVMDRYNTFCETRPTFKKHELSGEDQSKINEVSKLVSALNDASEWLANSIDFRYPTANKSYIICMELLDTIFKIAHCYGCEDIDDLINNKENYSNEECNTSSKSDYSESMEITLNRMFIILYRYKSMMEESSENPMWNALVLDGFSFTVFKGREDSYFKKGVIPSKLTARSRTDEHITSVIHSQTVEIEKILKPSVNGVLDKATSAAEPTSTTPPATPTPVVIELTNSADSSGEAPHPSTFKRMRSDGPLTSYEFNSDAELSDDDIPLKKVCARKAQAQQPTSSAFDMYLSQFKNDQRMLLLCNPCSRGVETEAKTNKNAVLSDLLYSERNNFGQMNFWNKAQPDYYADIGRLTKQCFAVPTTAKECLRVAEEAKKYYTGVSFLYPDSLPDENQQRTLMHIWRKDNNIIN